MVWRILASWRVFCAGFSYLKLNLHCRVMHFQVKSRAFPGYLAYFFSDSCESHLLCASKCEAIVTSQRWDITNFQEFGTIYEIELAQINCMWPQQVSPKRFASLPAKALTLSFLVQYKAFKCMKDFPSINQSINLYLYMVLVKAAACGVVLNMSPKFENTSFKLIVFEYP